MNMYIKATITSSTGFIGITHQSYRDGWHQQRLTAGLQTPYEIHWDEQANHDIEWVAFIADKWTKKRTLTSGRWRDSHPIWNAVGAIIFATSLLGSAAAYAQDDSQQLQQIQQQLQQLQQQQEDNYNNLLVQQYQLEMDLQSQPLPEDDQ